MRVEVERPAIAGDTVVFRWTQSEPNPYQYENSFFLRYEGIDLTRFSVQLFYEVFLGLQLRVFAGYGRAVELVFPEPVPYPVFAFWQAYHQADRVTMTPVAETASYSPWASSRSPRHDRRPNGVFFGGGKDSTLAACLLSELYGADSVVMLQFVHPFRRGDAKMDQTTRRQEELMLRPARETLKVATQLAWTDYLAQLRFEGEGRRVRPNLELYTAGLLPALLDWGVAVCTPGLPRTAYHVTKGADGRYVFRYAKSRPEMLATQSRHYHEVMGADIALTNIIFLFTTLMDFRLLAERYPHALKQIVMCVAARPEERWCYQCRKCAEYAFLSLSCGVVDPDFDYDRFLARSQYMTKMMTYAMSGVELSVYGNAPWYPGMSAGTHYLTFCHVFARIDPDVVAGRLGPEAKANLTIAKALFGNRLFPSVELLSTRTVDLIGTDVARAVARIAAEHFEVVEDLPGPFMNGN
ncbi:MAG TPA: hypothetical protein VH482_32855, partial [Thermomicrobiales bacterium]